MKNIARITLTFVTLALILSACAPQASATPFNPTPVTLIPEPKVAVNQAPPATDIQIGKIEAVQTVGCAQTGFVLTPANPDYLCSLDAQTLNYIFSPKETITASLFSAPLALAEGEMVNVQLIAFRDFSGAKEEASCVLLDSVTHEQLPMSFLVSGDKTIRADCIFQDGTELVMSYTIRPTQVICDPNIVWEEKTIPTDIVWNQPGIYVAELAFPLVTNEDAPWVNTPGWAQINTSDLPISFIGATGKILKFDPACNQDAKLDWLNKNMTSTRSQLSIWIDAGAVSK
jgi:hypothetical protein